MTIADTVREKTEQLPPEKQQMVLRYVESIAVTSTQERSAEGLRAALEAVRGIWADRTDLPEDSVAAAQVLRERAFRSRDP
jgi:hypothetical protein